MSDGDPPFSGECLPVLAHLAVEVDLTCVCFHPLAHVVSFSVWPICSSCLLFSPSRFSHNAMFMSLFSFPWISKITCVLKPPIVHKCSFSDSFLHTNIKRAFSDYVKTYFYKYRPGCSVWGLSHLSCTKPKGKITSPSRTQRRKKWLGLRGPGVFFEHWCADLTHGTKSRCPLLPLVADGKAGARRVGEPAALLMGMAGGKQLSSPCGEQAVFLLWQLCSKYSWNFHLGQCFVFFF